MCPLKIHFIQKILSHSDNSKRCCNSFDHLPSLLLFCPQRIADTIEALREDSGGTDENSLNHSYTLGGVGGEEGCCLQIVADNACTQSEEIRNTAQEAVYNALNVCPVPIPPPISHLHSIHRSDLIKFHLL